MSKKPKSNVWLKNLYRNVSGGLLDLAVKSQLIGDVPAVQTVQQVQEKQILTFYVLKEYSRSNSILIDLETKQHQLPPALANVVDERFNLHENSAMIFLHHPKTVQDHEFKVYSPRLLRLIEAVKTHPDLAIQFIPVTILWGRAPEKEDSIFNLLTADEWQVPSIAKQLFNIGFKGRDTFVQFHVAKDLRQILQEDMQDPDTVSDSMALLDNQQALEAVATRVQRRLQSYSDKQQETILGPDLSDRRNEVEKILYTDAIQYAIQEDSRLNQRTIKASQQLAHEYLNEIVSDYSASTVRFLDRFLTWLWTQLYDGVKVKHFDRVREVALDHEVIYVPCHRSHMDYLLLSYVIYKRGLRIPNIAAGDNLNLPILGKILRNGGAFFMRRSFKGNHLYAAVFREYMHSMLTRNTPIEYFVEGGRSRSGRLLPPKKGMIAMTVQSHLRQSGKPIAFIPTYIGYERIMEGGTYIGEMSGKPKESESLLGLLKTSKKIERIFGTVYVNFGKPLYLADFMQKFDVLSNTLPLERNDIEMPDNAMQMIDNLGVKIMQGINRAVVITPVALLSLVLLSTPQATLDEQSCLQQLALYQRLAQNLQYDEDMSITEMSPKEIIDYGIQLKLIVRTPHILGDMIRVASGQAQLLSYFRNNILHIYILTSLFSCLIQRNGKMSLEHIERLVEVIYPFLQAELFLKYSKHTLKSTVKRYVDTLVVEKLLIKKDDTESGITQILFAPEPNSQNYQQLSVLANLVEHSLERYFMVLALMSQQGSGKLTKTQLIDLCHLLGQRLSLLYASDLPDFFDRPLFGSFLDALQRLEYIHMADGELIVFDGRIDQMAKSARFILDLDTMHILQQIAHLTDDEIQRTLAELQQKKQRKFSRKK